ncbi:MAG: radical SAM protein [Treponema sp.]|jgi:biotin synthase|nr:radical SAM protein [Treponema sp.]
MDRIDMLKKIIGKAQEGKALTREDCLFLLEIEEHSYESGVLRGAASAIRREKTDNSAILLGQIGVESSPCPGGCRFCAFGEDHTSFKKYRMPDAELENKIDAFCAAGDLYGLYLMAMHDYSRDFYLETVHKARNRAPKTTQIWANIGDTDKEMFAELRKAGVSGVYHVCRLREGADTKLDPEKRKQTMRNVLDAGLKLYTCVEPIGPEHGNEELVENMFIGIDLGVFQHAAMRRIAVPGSPLYAYGQISELRLAHITAVIALASAASPSLSYMGAHEPGAICFSSGAEAMTAESGVNPRDTKIDTSVNRGMDTGRCRKMLYDCGFAYLRRGDESKIPLDFACLENTNSL